MNQTTRTLMTIDKGLHSRDNLDRLKVSIKEVGREQHKASRNTLKKEKRLITVAIISNGNIRTKRKKTNTWKQK